MWDFSIGQALALMGRTMPFIVLRVLVYAGIAIAYVLVTGVGAGVGWGIGAFGDEEFRAGSTIWGGGIGFALTAGVLYFAREYILYIVKAGHIAVLVEVLHGQEIPTGQGQIGYAREKVQERFKESSLLFGLDQLIKGILRTFNRTFLTIATILPIPGLRVVMNLLNTIVNLSLTYLDEVILAYLMHTKADNPWAAGRTALVLYAQNYKAFLKNAVWLALFIWGMTFAVFLLILGPAALLVGLFPGTAGPLTLIIAGGVAWGIKQAVIEPIGMTALMQVFFKVTAGQTAQPEWEAKLESLSAKFGEMKSKAHGWPAGSGEGGAKV